MTLIIPPGFRQARFIFTASGTAVRMSANFGFKEGSGFDLTTCAQDFADQWEANLSTITASTCTLDTVAIVGATTSSEKQVLVQGDSTAFDWDTYEAVVVKFSSGLRGAANRGRQYWPGLLPAGSVGIDGTLGAPTVEAFQVPFQTFFANLQSETGQVDEYVILHTSASAPTTAIDFSVSNRVGIQRRRRAKLT